MKVKINLYNRIVFIRGRKILSVCHFVCIYNKKIFINFSFSLFYIHNHLIIMKIISEELNLSFLNTMLADCMSERTIVKNSN